MVTRANAQAAHNADSALGWCGDGRSARAAQIAALWLACCRGCRWHDGQHDRPDAPCGGGLPGPAAVAGFYSALLGLPVIYRDDDWLVVAASDISSGLAFQRAPGNLPRTWPDAVQCSAVQQQFHLDIMVEDAGAAGARVLTLGAVKLDGENVYADPAGHPFEMGGERHPSGIATSLDGAGPEPGGGRVSAPGPRRSHRPRAASGRRRSRCIASGRCPWAWTTGRARPCRRGRSRRCRCRW